MAASTCSWCGRRFEAPGRRGPRPRYCCRAHRQRAYEARRKAARGNPPSSTGRPPPPEADPPSATGRYGLAIGLLGPVEAVRANGDPLPLSPEPRSILAALALEPRRIVPAEKLIDHIWPGIDDRAARRRLHTAVWKLRRQLAPAGAPAISWSSPGYVLSVADEQLDWVRFRRLEAAGDRALRRGAPALAKSYLSAALGLWRGDEALQGVELGIGDLWFVADQAAARRRAIRGSIEAGLLLGEYDEAVPKLEALLSLDPLDQEMVHRLALAHYRAGSPPRAVGVCRRYLESRPDEGAGPRSTPVAHLVARMLKRDPELDLPAPEEGGFLRPPAGTPQQAFLSASWERLAPLPPRLLPAEIQLVIDEHEGQVRDAAPASVEASFADAGSAMDAAAAVQLMLPSAAARIGVAVSLPVGVADELGGSHRARARLLGTAAHAGQILIAGVESGKAVRAALPAGGRLESLGVHRLNGLTPPSAVYRLVVAGLPDVADCPRWFERDSIRNLVGEPFRFVGRENEIRELVRRLEETRLLTLTGAPGCGKTRLATHVAAGLARQYRDGGWFVPLQPVSQPGLVVGAVAAALRIPRTASVEATALVACLRGKHALIILDNCEHVLGECRGVAEELLVGCEELTIVATSREALHSRFEHVLPIPPLEPPQEGATAAVLENPAVQLFCDRLREGRPGPEIDAEEAGAVARICRALDGVPLALVLAAARARELGAAALADALERALAEERGLRLISNAARAEAVSETLEGSIAWSCRMLSERERLVFARLSVFTAGFTADDAAAVCGECELASDDIVSAVDRLVQASLLTANAVGGRSVLRFLQPIRTYAAAELLGHGSAAGAVHGRHAEHCVALAERAEPELRGARAPATIHRVESSLPDLYAALRWAIANERGTIAVRIVGALWVFWLARGRIREGREMIESALALDASPSRERLKALLALAHLSWFGGDVRRCVSANREALAHAEALDDPWGRPWARLGLLAARMFGSEDDGVPAQIEALLPDFRSLGNAWDTCQALQTLGGAAWHRGSYQRAERALAEAAALSASMGHATAVALATHGLMLALLGRLGAGAAEVDRCLAMAYEAADLTALAHASVRRAAIARYAGQHRLARHHYRDALQSARDAGEGWAMQWALDGLGSADDLDPAAGAEGLRARVEVLARAEAMSHETGIALAPRERELHARDLSNARARLGEEVFAGAFAGGRGLDLSEAIERALCIENGQSSGA